MKLSFKTVTDSDEAQKLWELFSPHQTIDDEWDFRYTFFRYLDFPLHFIAGFDGDQPIGLLPLQLNTNKGMSQKRFGVSEPFLEFFGGIDTDNNRIFLSPGYEHLTNDFLGQVKSPAVLAPLSDNLTHSNQESIHYTDKFVSSLEDLNDLDAFMQRNFDGKSRQKLKNKINKLNRDYKIEIKKGSISDLNLLFALSKDRFGDDSAFHMDHRQEIFRDLYQLYGSDLFVVYADGSPKAVSFALLFKGTYDGINLGYDYEVRDLGKFVFLSQIERAIDLGCKRYDVGKNDNGWKEQFHLDKIPQYKLSLNQPTETKLLPMRSSVPHFKTA